MQGAMLKWLNSKLTLIGKNSNFKVTSANNTILQHGYNKSYFKTLLKLKEARVA
jgi:hypothetical protein